MAESTAEFLSICLSNIFFHGPKYFFCSRSVLMYFSSSSCLETCQASVLLVFSSASWYEVHSAWLSLGRSFYVSSAAQKLQQSLLWWKYLFFPFLGIWNQCFSAVLFCLILLILPQSWNLVVWSHQHLSSLPHRDCWGFALACGVSVLWILPFPPILVYILVLSELYLLHSLL